MAKEPHIRQSFLLRKYKSCSGMVFTGQLWNLHMVLKVARTLKMKTDLIHWILAHEKYLSHHFQSFSSAILKMPQDSVLKTHSFIK